MNQKHYVWLLYAWREPDWPHPGGKFLHGVYSQGESALNAFQDLERRRTEMRIEKVEMEKEPIQDPYWVDRMRRECVMALGTAERVLEKCHGPVKPSFNLVKRALEIVRGTRGRYSRPEDILRSNLKPLGVE